MTEHRDNTLNKREMLSEAFGKVTVIKLKLQGTTWSASVPGFAKYGQHTFFLSRGGNSEEDAVNNLFDQVAQSAGRENEFEMDLMGRSRVFRSEDDKEVVFYQKPIDDQNKRFHVTDRTYSEPYYG